MKATFFFNNRNKQKKQKNLFTDSSVHHCFYCGNECGSEHSVSKNVKKTFTNHDIVTAPSSHYVCSGCVVSMNMGYPLFNMIDGEQRIPKTTRAGQPRLYSWVMSEKEMLTASKTHIFLLREKILNPPAPPFAIVLADSGQKQIIFRCPIAYDTDFYPLQFEEETIVIDIAKLKKLLKIADMISAACGKIVLKSAPSQMMSMAVYKYYGSVQLVEQWIDEYATGLGQLAAWLAKSKKEAQIEYQKINR